MAITFTNIGTNNNASGATVALSGVTVPAAATIVVVGNEGGTPTGNPISVSDTVNSYSTITLRGSPNFTNYVSTVVAQGITALSGATITATKDTSGDPIAISALYITGVVTTGGKNFSAFSANTSNAVTASGNSTLSGVAVVAGFGTEATTTTTTQATGFSAPFNSVAANAYLFGGSQIAGAAGTVTYNPTITAGNNAYSSFIIGFAAAAAATAVPWFQNTSSDVLRRTPYSFGAIAPKDDGIQIPETNWKNAGWEVQSFQPPKRAPLNRLFGWPDWNEDGNESKQFVWRNFGWEVQPVQPPSRPPKRLIGWPNWAEDGNELPFVPPAIPAVNGWDPPLFQPPHYIPPQRYAGTKGKSEFAIPVPWINQGWEVQPPQPPHPRPERSGAIAPISVIDALYNLWVNDGWEVQPPQPPSWPKPQRGAFMRGDDGTQAVFFPLITLINNGWHVQPWQPRLWPDSRRGAILPKEDGTELQFSPFSLWVNDGWEVQPWQPPAWPNTKRGAIMPHEDGTEFPFVNWANIFFWEIEQPPRRRWERAAAIMPHGDDGSEAKFIFTFKEGWQVQPWQPPRPRWEKSAALAVHYDGSEFPFQLINQLLRNAIVRARTLENEDERIRELRNAIVRARTLLWNGPRYN